MFVLLFFVSVEIKENRQNLLFMFRKNRTNYYTNRTHYFALKVTIIIVQRISLIIYWSVYYCSLYTNNEKMAVV